ncbi:hypothetical protein MCACP_11170 [Neomoorella carbonis]
MDSLRLIKFEKNRYSMPVNLVGKTVTVKGYPFQVKVYYHSQEVAIPPRTYLADQTCLVLEHYLPVLVQKPRSLANAAPLRRASLPPGLYELKERLLDRGEDRELARILGLVMVHGIEEVEKAIKLALQSGQNSFQAVRYYLGQQDNAGTNQVQLDTAFPMVAAVNLEAYDSLLGGGVH